MSLMNCFISNDRALVAVDTAVTVGEASKLAILPHANTVLAMRGEVMFFGQVHAALNLCHVNGFDGLAEVMPQIFAQVYAQRQAFIDKHPFAGIEIALVGWSTALGRMQGVRYERWPDDKGPRITPIVPWSLSPNPGYTPDTPPDSAERMEAIAKDQVRVLRQLPMVVAGGRLLVAELTHDAASVRTVADLESSGITL